jgi:hypothetical protein
MMKLRLIGLAILAMALAGCEQQLAKSGWGSMQIDLQCGQALENVTWKGEELWYLTRPMQDGEVPTTHRFKAKSVLGILEGEVILRERGCSKP